MENIYIDESPTLSKVDSGGNCTSLEGIQIWLPNLRTINQSHSPFGILLFTVEMALKLYKGKCGRQSEVMKDYSVLYRTCTPQTVLTLDEYQ
jgi:hypothetical protein